MAYYGDVLYDALIGNEEVRKGYQCAWQINYHLVFPVNYRELLLDAEVAEIISETAQEISDRYAIDMKGIGCDRDHLHLLCTANPKIEPGKIVRVFKSITVILPVNNGHLLKLPFWFRRPLG